MGTQGGTIPVGMVAEPSLTDLLGEMSNNRQAFHAVVEKLETNDTTTIKGGFNTVSQLMSTFERMFNIVNKRFERSEGAIISSLNRPAKLHNGDAGNHKAIQSLKMFDCDREKFVEWNDKLLNALSRIHPHARTMLKGMNKRWMSYDSEKKSQEEIFDDLRNWSEITAGDDRPHERAYDNTDKNALNEDLYYVLVEKTTGEAAIKVKAVDEGQGLLAYFKIYWWFVKTSGIAIQDRSRKVMQPEVIQSEAKMMDGIEAWEADFKVLEAQRTGFTMNDQMKLIALDIMFSKFSSVFERIESQLTTNTAPEDKLKMMLTNLKAHAAKRRWESHFKKGKGNPLPVDEFEEDDEEKQQYLEPIVAWLEDGQGGYYQDTLMVDAVGKGKGTGKGTKGKTNMQCFKCLKYGHSARDCNGQVKCHVCHEEGHIAKDCPKAGQGKGTPNRLQRMGSIKLERISRQESRKRKREIWSVRTG